MNTTAQDDVRAIAFKLMMYGGDGGGSFATDEEEEQAVKELFLFVSEREHAAELWGRIDELKKVNNIPSEVGKLANHSLKVSVYLDDRLAELKKLQGENEGEV